MAINAGMNVVTMTVGVGVNKDDRPAAGSRASRSCITYSDSGTGSKRQLVTGCDRRYGRKGSKDRSRNSSLLPHPDYSTELHLLPIAHHHPGIADELMRRTLRVRVAFE